MTVRTVAATEPYLQNIGYLACDITYADNGTAKTIGVLPAGATILKALSGITVTTAFNAGTTNTVNVGTSADDNLYGTLLAAGATDFVPLDEAVSYAVSTTAPTTMTVTVVLTGTAATAGAAKAVIAFVM